MNDDKLKIILAILGGLFFGLIFMLLAFILPIESKKDPMQVMNENLQKLSQDYKDSKLKPPPPNQ